LLEDPEGKPGETLVRLKLVDQWCNVRLMYGPF
jgi:hypothetical protein